jgi:hypothetical protein
MRKKHGSVPKLHTCSGLDSHNERKHWHSKCHYQRNSSSVPAGTNNPTRSGNPRGDRESTGGPPPPDPATAATTPAPGGEAASAAASGQILRQEGSHPQRTRTSHSGRETETRATGGVGNLIGREAIFGCRSLEARRQVFALVRTAQSVGAALAVRSATVVRTEGVVLRPSRAMAAHLSQHGWRKSPRNWRMPFSPRRQGKKRAADPCGGSPPDSPHPPSWPG